MSATVLEELFARRLVLELTEHAPVAVYGPLLAALTPLRARGVRVTIDEAGAGSARRQHILHLDPDILKLDIALTRGIVEDPPHLALGTALAAFGRDVDAATVAEGIETRAELQTLRSLGVRWGRGYHLARPSPLPLPSPWVESLVEAA